jgi:hypothetical protein
MTEDHLKKTVRQRCACTVIYVFPQSKYGTNGHFKAHRLIKMCCLSPREPTIPPKAVSDVRFPPLRYHSKLVVLPCVPDRTREEGVAKPFRRVNWSRKSTER